jgi:3-phosphoshikimate 1-carboxyvinyltransferase
VTYALIRSRGSAPLGVARAPGSKSCTNRALLLAALADGTSTLHDPLDAHDTRVMAGALEALGVPVVCGPRAWTVRGGARPRARGPVDVGASGTTLRFLLPWLACNADGPVDLRGAARLFERPLAGLLDALAGTGARLDRRGPGRAVLIPGDRPTTDFEVDARASSQFVTGLALAVAGSGGGTVRFGAAPSASYLDLTREWLDRFGCRVADQPGGWVIGGSPRATDVVIPGDWSGAAAFLAAGAVSGRDATVVGLDPHDPQGDRALAAILADAGVRVSVDAAAVRTSGSLRSGFDHDLSACPDLAPVLVAAAALAPTASVLRGLGTLRDKECDRFAASMALVQWVGGRASAIDGEALRVWPSATRRARGVFSSRADHRMAFAAAVAGLVCGGRLAGAHAVTKTFPAFWSAWAASVRSGRR